MAIKTIPRQKSIESTRRAAVEGNIDDITVP
jgi:hypothetical protein